MSALWLALTVIASTDQPMQPVLAKYSQNLPGRSVKVCIDGQKVKTTFAGPMGFQDKNHSWVSFCADVRSPITRGQMLMMKPMKTTKAGGRAVLAGNIVSNCYPNAKNADQLAAIQLAVWEVLEDGGEHPGFNNGRFQAMGSQAVMSYAHQYYAMAKVKKEAYLMVPMDGKSQTQVTPGRNFEETKT